MKLSEFKKIVKPIVKEIIFEVVTEEFSRDLISEISNKIVSNIQQKKSNNKLSLTENIDVDDENNGLPLRSEMVKKSEKILENISNPVLKRVARTTLETVANEGDDESPVEKLPDHPIFEKRRNQELAGMIKEDDEKKETFVQRKALHNPELDSVIEIGEKKRAITEEKKHAPILEQRQLFEDEGEVSFSLPSGGLMDDNVADFEVAKK